MNRLQIALYIALGGTAITAIGIILCMLTDWSDFAGYILFLGIGVGWVSYIFGGLWTAIKMSAGIAKWGWLIVPFPYDIMTFVFAFAFAGFAFLFLPIIPVFIAYRQGMQ